MKQETSITEFLQDLKTLTDTNTLEYIFDRESHTGFIPYMMNDALECYYSLSGCNTTGSFLMDFAAYKDGWRKEAHLLTEEEKTKIEYIAPSDQEKRHCIIIRQGMVNVVSIWFDKIHKEYACYEHHRIGHFWVEGGEQLRQLNYIIATIYDKYMFLPETLSLKVCNEEELSLLPLTEFPPLRYYYPVKDDIFGRYPDTEEGALLMEDIAKKTGAKRLRFLSCLYRKLFFGNMSFPAKLEVLLNYPLTKYIAREIIHKRSIPVYLEIWERVKKACASYPKRVYDKESLLIMEEKRKEADSLLNNLGYHGNYPFYQKETKKVYEYVTVTEEHPFTILEGDFGFSLHFMYSKTPDSTLKDCPNAGFFTGKGHTGKIYTPEDFKKHFSTNSNQTAYAEYIQRGFIS